MPHKYPILEIKKRRALIYGPFTVFRAKSNGSPFLIDEKTTWRDVNGFMIQIKGYRITIMFKRRVLTP